MTPFRLPDNPRQISLELLKEFDQDTPGTWIGSPKLDGYRRIMHNLDGKWTHIAKHAGPASKQFDTGLQSAFDTIRWPNGTAIDAEFMGPRQSGTQHTLHIFDLLYWKGEWLGPVPYAHRLDMLDIHVAPLLKASTQNKVFLMPYFHNPGLVEQFALQLQNPLSEGLVVRRLDALNTGMIESMSDNPYIFKVKFKQVHRNVIAGGGGQ